jgi:hypothetical protein
MNNSVKVDTLATFNTTGLNGTFKPINAAGFAGPAILLRVINASTVAVTLTFDGVHSNDYLGSGETLQLNLQSNAAPNNYVSVLKKGTVVSVKGSAGTGNVYLAVYYLES